MEIEVLPGLEAVRRRPQLYLGELGREDLFDDLILESLCHAIDEAMDSNCHDISIRLETADAILVRYDAGINLELHPKSGKRLVDILLTELRACHNLKKHMKVGSEYCQYGLAVLNALHEVHLDRIQARLKEMNQVLGLKLNVIFSSIAPV
jgi:DNA gyrase/topoisomerase IV subunit B